MSDEQDEQNEQKPVVIHKLGSGSYKLRNMALFYIEFTQDDRLRLELALADGQIVQVRARYEMWIRNGRIITDRPPWEPFADGRWHLLVRYNLAKGDAIMELTHVGLNPKSPHGVKVVTRWGKKGSHDFIQRVCQDLLENWNAYRSTYAGAAAKINHPDGIHLAEGNLGLASRFLAELVAQPQLIMAIPDEATIVFQPNDDPWLQDQNRIFVSRVEKVALREFGEPSELAGQVLLIQVPRTTTPA